MATFAASPRPALRRRSFVPARAAASPLAPALRFARAAGLARAVAFAAPWLASALAATALAAPASATAPTPPPAPASPVSSVSPVSPASPGAPRPADPSVAALAATFAQHPTASRPGCYWWWLDGRVDAATITRDLEEFAAKGIGEVLLVNSTNFGHPPPAAEGVKFLSPEWRELYRHALREARRLGIEFGVNLSGGWCMGGPWIPPRHAGRWFLQSRLTVNGPTRLADPLPLPGHRDGYDKVFNPPGFKDYIDLPLAQLDYRDTAVVAFREPDEAGDADRLTGARAQALPAKTNRRDASNWTRARDVMGPTLVPWPAAPDDRPIPVAGVIDLTARLRPDGRLDWDVPPGRWTIVRTGHRMTGSRLMIPPPEVDGLSVGWLSREGVELQFQHLGELLLADAQAAGTPLKYFCDDSFEDGFPNWTEQLVERFRHYRGYDPVPYFPVLNGYLVGSAEISDRFLYDYRRTVADCMADGHYRTFAELCHARGLLVQNESAGPSRSGTMCMDGLMNLGRSDLPMGEFWLGTRHDEPGGLDPKLSYGVSRLEDGQNKVTKMVASAAHLYGRPLASAESFTTMRHWLDYPGNLKPAADRAFCEGINRLVLHTSTLSRPSEGLPGYEYYAGNHFNPQVTWWPQSGAFLAYVARCQQLLRAGRFAADVLYYNGDHAPNLVEPKQVPADLGPGYDYDVANTEILLTRLSVRAGRLVTPEGQSYRLLVLPPTTTMPAAVARRLQALVRAGATLIGPRPERDPGLRDYPHSDAAVRAIAAELWGDLDGRTRTQRSVGAGRVVWGQTARAVLTADGVYPDFNYDGPAGALDFIHRTTDDADFYFVVNRENRARRAAPIFRVTGAAPELWDPVTGAVRTLPEWTATPEGVRVPLLFAPQQSWFIVFRRPAAGSPGATGSVAADPARAGEANCPVGTTVQTLTGAWTVRFDPRWGGPAAVEFAQLTDWTQHADAGIRFYSGRATYEQTFTAAAAPGAAGGRVWLDLGTVRHIAAVRLNGVDLGIVWCAPWRTDATRAWRAGENRLEIDVVNLWPNRLLGDKDLPPAKRFTRTNIPLPKDAKLIPSGLLGPVTVRMER